jgi:signal transduction histidine kinase/ligand-binding sensor domain-containing protein/DNA-binding response OmpR family regulator
VQFVHEAWGIDDGLPINEVNDLVQTRDGYLWLATFDGLVRFDGVRFTVYNIANSPGLPSNRIVDLFEARDGGLWLRTEDNLPVRFKDERFRVYRGGTAGDFRGVLIYQEEDGAVWVGTTQHVYHLVEDSLIPIPGPRIGRTVSALVRGRSGELWIGTVGGGLLLYRDGELTRYTTEEGLPSNRVEALHLDPSGALWVGTERGVSVLRDGRVETLTDDGAPWPRLTWMIASDSIAGVHWFGTEDGVFAYRAGRIEPYPLSGEIPRDVFSRQYVIQRGPDGQLWIAAGRQLYRNGEPVWQGDLPIREFLWDHEGSLWIAGDGLHRLKPSLFTVIGGPEGAVEGVYPIFQDRDGALWFGSLRQGLTRYRDGVVATFGAEDGLPPTIFSLGEDRDGTLLVGQWEGGLCRFTGSRCAPIGRDGGPGVGQGFGFIKAIHTDRHGSLWVGTLLGLFRRDTTGRWARFTMEDGLTSDFVRAITETRDDELWFGTNGGGVIRLRDGRFDGLTSAEGLSSDLVRSIHEDADGVLWIGTEGRGLNRVVAAPKLRDASITVLRQQDGLYDDVIHQILEDDYGRFWMSTNRGIFSVARDELEAFAAGTQTQVHSLVYTERDGLRNPEANGGMQPAGIKARDGRLWFPTMAGAAVVDPARIRSNDVPPPVTIEHLTSAGATVGSVEDVLALDADQRDFEIEYTALSFLAPENVRFRYRLEGFNDEWVEAGTRRRAFYTNVPAGRYTFRVIATNNDGVWNEEGASIAVSVAPHFYETAWFVGLVLVGVVVAGVGGVRWRLRYLEKRQRELRVLVDARTQELVFEKEASEESRLEAERQRLEADRLREVAEQARLTIETQARVVQELDEAKSRFFANVSHEFRTPLTLVIGPLQDLLAGLHGSLSQAASYELDVAVRNAQRLLRLVNQLLDVAKLEAGRVKLQARRADMGPFLRDVALSFAPFAERRGIRFTVDVPERPMALYFDPDLLEKVFSNLLSNAFKFSGAEGAVRLTAIANGVGDTDNSDDGLVVVTVKDNGPGIAPENLSRVFERFYRVAEAGDGQNGGTGIGLSLAKELVDLHGAEIVVDSEVGFGTTFTVTLQRGRRHLADDQVVEGDKLPTRAPRWEVDPLDVATVEAVSEEVVGGQDSGQADGDVPTVLVVDDNAEIRHYMRTQLAPQYRVVEAANGDDALEEIRRIVPDLVVSDVMMCGLDGTALCRAVKADPELEFIPVILLTAKASAESKVTGLEAGADDYLTKPFSVAELRARVDNLIRSRHRLRDRLSERKAIHARPVTAASSDDVFLERLRDAIEAELSNPELTMERLAQMVGQSRSNLYRRVRDILQESPADVIRTMRLERAGQLLEQQAGTVSEIAYGVGFQSVSHFCRCFRQTYGVTPSQHRQGAPR